MKNTRIGKFVSKTSSHATKVESIFRNEDDIFFETLNQHKHDRSFFISMAEKAGIYDASGKLKSSYRR